MRNPRYLLLPPWIRFFSWIFLFFFLTPLAFFAVFTHKPVAYDCFGMHFNGSPLALPALLIQTVLLFFALSAYTLLWGRWIGIRLGLVCGYAGLVICLVSMALSFWRHSINIRLEPFFQIPFIMAPTRVRNAWESR